MANRPKRAATPYVVAEIRGGRLIRLCPECRDEIVEVTDAAGMVSDNFTAHWEAEHQEQLPERQRCYLIGFQPRTDDTPGLPPEAARNTSRHILGMVKGRMQEVDWELVERVDDLPDGAPALIAYEVLRGSWQSEGDDPQMHKVRWYRREDDNLVFTPTSSQWSEWDAASERARDVRAALIERRRDELPKFKGKTVVGWERFSKRLMRKEGEIAASFDERRDEALQQFLRGDYRWQATIETAIADLAIPDDEVGALRERTRKRLEEVEGLLAV